MSSAEQRVRWHAVADRTAMQQEALRRVAAAARRAVRARGRFALVLAGGRTPRGLYRLLRAARADWPRWHVYFGDERCVPREDAGRNSRMAFGAWLDHVQVPVSQVHVIPAERGARAAARAYGRVLERAGAFDLVLLGLGEDGHTASLFPGREWGAAPDAPDALAVLDAPKPPPQRDTLSAARLSRAREVLVLVEGAGKRAAVGRWRAGEDIPARAIRPDAGVDVLVESRLLASAGALRR